MSTNICEAIRKIIIQDLMNVPTIKKSWILWKPEIQRILGNNPDGSALLDLGDHLSNIFQKSGSEGRTQSSVAAGGKAWEGLAAWYINLICANTGLIAFPTMKLVPQFVKEAISVKYQTITCNTESDITVVIFPEIYRNTFTDSWPKRTIQQYFLGMSVNDLRDFQVGIIQCKTNWNDNAQIPMLWNLVYSANNFINTSISVGSSRYGVRDFGRFTYSFLTVPTTKKSTMTSKSTHVLRVNTLSGGNFWGHPSQSQIAFSVKEIFNRNFRDAFQVPIIVNAGQNLKLLTSSLDYFDVY